MVTHVEFVCGTTVFPETPTRLGQINRERNYNSRSCEKPQCIPSNDQHTCSADKQHSSYIFLNPHNLWDMVPAALLSLNHTNDTYSMFNRYPQPTTQQPRTDLYPVFSSLRTADNKRKGMRVSFAFFQRIYIPDGRVNATIATVEELSRSPEQWTEFHRFWWTVIVFKCSYLFQFFDFFCLLVQNLLFSWKITFFVAFFDDFEWEKNSLTTSM